MAPRHLLNLLPPAKVLPLLACLLLIISLAKYGDSVALIQKIDNIWLDSLIKARANIHRADPQIVIIDIDDNSLKSMAAMRGNWPWPRAMHAELIEWLEQQGVKQIAFDMWFSESDLYRPDSDSYFGEVLNKYHNIFLSSVFLEGISSSLAPPINTYPASIPFKPTPNANLNAHAQLLLPVMGDPKQWHIGIVNYLKDSDGICRRYNIFRDIEGWKLYSLPAVMAQANGIELPTTMDFNLDWISPIETPFTRYSYADIYTLVLNDIAKPDLKDKVIFIGSTAIGLHDMRPTPMLDQYPGLYILATAYNNLLNGEDLLRLSLVYTVPLGLLPLLLIGFTLFSKQLKKKLPMPYTFVLLLIAIISTYMKSHYLGLHGQLLPVNSMAIVACTVFFIGAIIHYFYEKKSRQHAIDMFGRFLDKSLVEELTNVDLNESVFTARSVELTILFSDIRGFTALSETQSPATIMNLLNIYFSQQVIQIFKHKGTLDKFIGDAIMAFWGAPLADPEHAANAVAAALDMSDALEIFKREQNLPDFEIGIGVHTGPAVVGMLGSNERLEYTAIGDTINLGSRLEALTKDKARILVSEATKLACGNKFEFRLIGSYNVKGRQEPVTVYEPLKRLE